MSELKVALLRDSSWSIEYLAIDSEPFWNEHVELGVARCQQHHILYHNLRRTNESRKKTTY